MSVKQNGRKATQHLPPALAVTTLMSMLGTPALAASDLLTDGSFEAHPATTAVPNGTAELINKLGTLPGGGWQVDALDGGPILLKGNAYLIDGVQTPLGPADGLQYLYLSNGGIGGTRIIQGVSLTPGLYTLTFAIGGWALTNQTYQPTLDVLVSGATGSLLSVQEVGMKFDGLTTTLPSPAWKAVTEQFAVATAGTYSLSFEVASNGINNFATLAGCLALARLVRGQQQARP